MLELCETNQVINVYHLIVQGQACEAMEGMAVSYVGPTPTENVGTLVQKAEEKYS